MDIVNVITVDEDIHHKNDYHGSILLKDHKIFCASDDAKSARRYFSEQVRHVADGQKITDEDIDSFLDEGCYLGYKCSVFIVWKSI